MLRRFVHDDGALSRECTHPRACVCARARGCMRRMARRTNTAEQTGPSVAREIELWPVDRLKPYKRNAKAHPAEQIALLARIIAKHGFDQPIAVDGKGVIVKGHGRWLAARELGMPTVPVVVRSDLSAAEAAEARLADNRVAEFGYDFGILRDELIAASELPGFDVDLTGFDLEEIAPDHFLGSDVDESKKEEPEVSRQDGLVKLIFHLTEEQHKTVHQALGKMKKHGASTNAEALAMLSAKEK